jgi:hypothetical protein
MTETSLGPGALPSPMSKRGVSNSTASVPAIATFAIAARRRRWSRVTAIMTLTR